MNFLYGRHLREPYTVNDVLDLLSTPRSESFGFPAPSAQSDGSDSRLSPASSMPDVRMQGDSHAPDVQVSINPLTTQEISASVSSDTSVPAAHDALTSTEPDIRTSNETNASDGQMTVAGLAEEKGGTPRQEAA
jgi:hypothetical protein